MESTILKLLELRSEMQEGINGIMSDSEPEFVQWETSMIYAYRRMINILDAELAAIKGITTDN